MAPIAVNGRSKVVGVFGDPIGHSRSPQMQNAAIRALGLDWIYAPFHVVPTDLEAAVAAVRALKIVGVNLTVPHKERVSDFLDEIDPFAERIGSVNTIVNRDGRLVGYSTDGAGFLWDLERQSVSIAGKRVVIWGAGGAARALAFALAGRVESLVIANRSLERAERLAKALGESVQAVELSGSAYEDALESANFYINTTTMGMGPKQRDEYPPLCGRHIGQGDTIYDIVYSPERTALLQIAEGLGARILGGIGMLVCQGAVSLSLWTEMDLGQMPIMAMIEATETGAIQQ